MFFRTLTPVEESKFREWAHENYKAGSEIKGCWHPVTQDECVKMNRRAAVFVDDLEVDG